MHRAVGAMDVSQRCAQGNLCTHHAYRFMLWDAGKCLTITSSLKKNTLICSICPFLWCRLSYHGQFQGASMASLHAELRRGAHRRQPQHSAEFVSATAHGGRGGRQGRALPAWEKSANRLSNISEPGHQGESRRWMASGQPPQPAPWKPVHTGAPC